MATYTYRAINKESQIINDQIEAINENDLEERLGSRGLTLINASKRSFEFKTRLKLNEADLLSLTYFLKLIFSSGMSLLEGLNSIGMQSSNSNVSRAAAILHDKIESGKSIYGSMIEHPDLFPDIYVSLIRAGEVSGNMDQVLEDAMSYLKWKIKLKKEIGMAFVYPLIVMGAVFSLIAILFIFVLPKLVAVLTTMNAELPLVTRVLISGVEIARDYWPLILLFLIAAPVALNLYYRSYSGRRHIDRFILKLPVIGQLLIKFDHSRYFRTFSTLFKAGMSMDKTLNISASVIKNTYIAKTFDDITNSVLGGELLSESFSRTGDFPPLIVNILEIGEKTGSLDTSILNISDIYDKDVPETVKKIFVIIEPVMIFILGIIVLLTISSFFLPLYKVVGSIRR